MKIFTEASGSLVSVALINSLKNADLYVIASDIDQENVGGVLANKYLQVPRVNDPRLWKLTLDLLVENQVNLVLPSFDEMLYGWSTKNDWLRKHNIELILSPINTIKTFSDKWHTYLAFLDSALPSPKTSLQQIYPMQKPRIGRGSKGIIITEDPVNMNNMISQEIVKGTELTVDCLFDLEGRPIYIVPRMRLKTVDGKSIVSEVIEHNDVEQYILNLSQKYHFIGPVNIQCFVDNNNIWFIEVNPRVSGGMALSWAATENWFKLWVDRIMVSKSFNSKPIKIGLKMYRYYAETFV